MAAAGYVWGAGADDGGDGGGGGGGEEEFPTLCETCLGPNPYVRMTRNEGGGVCRICERPYNHFQWKPGSDARYKQTVVCQHCARSKNVCQTCLLDLQYGLPVQLRDKVLAQQRAAQAADAARKAGATRVSAEAAASLAAAQATVPQSDQARDWMVLQQMQREQNPDAAAQLPIPQQPHQQLAEPSVLLEQLSRSRAKNAHRRNKPRKCNFFAQGKCTRGDRCPFLHEMPTAHDDPMAKQSIGDRFHGRNDPVAEKLLDQTKGMATPQPPPPPPPSVPLPPTAPPPCVATATTATVAAVATAAAPGAAQAMPAPAPAPATMEGTHSLEKTKKRQRDEAREAVPKDEKDNGDGEDDSDDGADDDDDDADDSGDDFDGDDNDDHTSKDRTNVPAASKKRRKCTS